MPYPILSVREHGKLPPPAPLPCPLFDQVEAVPSPPWSSELEPPFPPLFDTPFLPLSPGYPTPPTLSVPPIPPNYLH